MDGKSTDKLNYLTRDAVAHHFDRFRCVFSIAFLVRVFVETKERKPLAVSASRPPHPNRAITYARGSSFGGNGNECAANGKQYALRDSVEIMMAH